VEISRREGFATVGRGHHLEACETQRRGQQLTNVGFVINHKKLGFGTVLFHVTHDPPSYWEFSECCM